MVELRLDLGVKNLAIGPLDKFLAEANQHPPTIADRTQILDQAALMLNNLYPHLPFKLEEFRFTHPVDWLEQNVRPFLTTLNETDFHGLVIAAFSLVRDAHTLYGLPSPFRGAVAFLPFQLRFYVMNDERHYVVSKVMHGFDHETFKPGVEIFQWSGFPVDSVVQAISERLPGGNEDAIVSRATFHMTLRPLTFCQPPSDQETLKPRISYCGRDGQNHELLVPWGVATGIERGHAFPTGGFSMNSNHDCADDWYRCMQCSSLPPAMAAAYAVAAPAPTRTPTPAEAELSLPSQVPEAFEVQFTGGPFKEGMVDPELLTTDPPSDARVGYIRIKRFSDGSQLGNTAAIVAEFRRLLILMDSAAPDGLILDLRSNPGGDLIAAEQMLQMLTPTEIEPARFHLANTPAVLQVLQHLSNQQTNRADLTPREDVKLTEALVALKPWLADAANVPLPHGERVTSGQTLTARKDANRFGQVYHGRTVLLIDALTYSAAEIFAAGFQDHAIGQIIGMDHNTGGGGANVWTHDDLLNKLGPMTGLNLEKLPADVTMSIAIRRNSRVGFFPGQWVEDVGVKADETYVPDSLDDVLFDYPGLVHRACNMIMQAPQFRADPIKAAVNADGSVQIDLRSINIDAIDVFLDDAQVLTKHPVTRLPDQAPSTQSISVPAAANNKRPGRIRIAAFTLAPGRDGDQLFLAAVHRNALPPPPPAPRLVRPVAKSSSTTP
ncbi:MAG: S41 family peptidase [Candidatus Solibacter sp.]